METLAKILVVIFTLLMTATSSTPIPVMARIVPPVVVVSPASLAEQPAPAKDQPVSALDQSIKITDPSGEDGTLVVTPDAVGIFLEVPIGKPQKPNCGVWYVYRESSNNPSVIMMNEKFNVLVANSTLVQKQYGKKWQTVGNDKSDITVSIANDNLKVALRGLGTNKIEFAPQ